MCTQAPARHMHMLYVRTCAHTHSDPHMHSCITHAQTHVCRHTRASLGMKLQWFFSHHCTLRSLGPPFKEKRVFLCHSIQELGNWVFHLLLYSQRCILSILLYVKGIADSNWIRMRDHGTVLKMSFVRLWGPNQFWKYFVLPGQNWSSEIKSFLGDHATCSKLRGPTQRLENY